MFILFSCGNAITLKLRSGKNVLFYVSIDHASRQTKDEIERFMKNFKLNVKNVLEIDFCL